MNRIPAVLAWILLPIVLLNYWLTIEGRDETYFIVWSMVIAILVWSNAIWVFVEIFKEVKRRKNENIL